MKLGGYESHSYYDIILDNCLCHYETPDSGIFDQADWKNALADSMRAAGLKVNPVPPQLMPSLAPMKDSFLGQDINPCYFTQVSDLLRRSYVLCPALSYFKPGHLSGDTIAIGYQVAIGISGETINELIKPAQILSWEGHPEFSRILITTIHQNIKEALL